MNETDSNCVHCSVNESGREVSMNSLSARVRKLAILLLIALPLIGMAQTPKPEDVCQPLTHISQIEIKICYNIS